MRTLAVAGLLCCLLALCVGVWAQAGPPETPRAARIKADLRDILSAPQYRVQKPQESMLARVLQWIGDKLEAAWEWFTRLFGFGGVGGGGGNLFFWIVLVVVIIAVAYAIAYTLQRTSLQRRNKTPGPKPDVTGEPEESAAATPEEWLEAARRHAAGGDFRRAYRAVFIAMLLRLDRLGAIRFERSRTNGEYLRALRSRQNLYALLNPLARDFDAHWYGKAPVAEADYQRFLRAFESIPVSQ